MKEDKSLEDRKFYWKDTVPDLSWQISLGVARKHFTIWYKGVKKLYWGGSTNSKKLQSSDIQVTQSIFGSFLVIKQTYLQSIHSKQQCNLNIFKNFQTSLCLSLVGATAPQQVKVRSCSVVRCIRKADRHQQTNGKKAGVWFVSRRPCPTLKTIQQDWNFKFSINCFYIY